jgi:hypothetical protein
MLYILHKGNHPDVDYREGQQPIVHLRADFHAVVEWAEVKRRRWAFSNCNAGATYASFYRDLGELDQLNWHAISANQWNEPIMMDGKQAEFLVHESFPWRLVERIGVCSDQMAEQVSPAIAGASHRPAVAVERGWYY